MAKTQRYVKTLLHTTSEAKIDYGMEKSKSGCEHDAGRKEYHGMSGVHVHCVSAHD